MVCMVCERAIAAGSEQYANAWEKARKRYPCCSATCCDRFDPDVHWIPQVFPEPASQADHHRLLVVARDRITSGDQPSVVIREMLLAGIRPSDLRKILVHAHAESKEHNAASTRKNLLGGLFMLLGGKSSFRGGDKRDPAAVKAALADLDRWEQRALPTR